MRNKKDLVKELAKHDQNHAAVKEMISSLVNDPSFLRIHVSIAERCKQLQQAEYLEDVVIGRLARWAFSEILFQMDSEEETA